MSHFAKVRVISKISTLSFVFLQLFSQACPAALSVSSTPLFIKEGAEPNVMVLLDTSGSMNDAVPDPKFEPGYDKGSVNYVYDVCTRIDKNSECRSWELLNASKLSSGTAKAAMGCNLSGYVSLRKRIDGENVAYGGKCMKLPSSLYVGSYTFDIEYLYYLIDAKPTRTDLSGLLVAPNVQKLQIAKNVLNGSIENGIQEEGIFDIKGLRYGLSTFRESAKNGAKVIAGCTSRTDTSALKGMAKNTIPEGQTPLAESYYELSRYFRGLKPFFTPIDTYGKQSSCKSLDDGAITCDSHYKSPVTSQCQNNYIIVVTDGYPADDGYHTVCGTGTGASNGSVDGGSTTKTECPEGYHDVPVFPQPGVNEADPQDPDYKLPDWDGVKTDDPYGPSGVASCKDYTQRKFMSGSDGIKQQATTQYPCNGVSYADYASSLYLDDLALFGLSLDQKISTYTVGFTVDHQMLMDSAKNGNGKYFTAENTSELHAALESSIYDIQSRQGSGSAVATSTSRLEVEESAYVYQAVFDSNDWSGRIDAYTIDSMGQISKEPIWQTKMSSFKPFGSRLVRTLGGDFTIEKVRALGISESVLSDAQVNWIKGDTNGEKQNNGTLRDRKNTLLGDIVDSNISYLGSDLDFSLDQLPSDLFSGAGSYRKFVNDNKTNKNFGAALFVGANDGMLHAFDAATGDEIFAYIPSTIVSSLGDLTNPSYAHKYYVDGSPFVGHAYIKGKWCTILIGSTGWGGKSGTTLFAIDITDVKNPKELWEYSSDNLGFSNAKPILAPMANGKFGVFIANGYNSGDQAAKLIVLDAETGSEMKVISTAVGDSANPNGLSQPVLIPSSQRFISQVYAGDLQGNLWKIYLESSNKNDWKVSFNNSDGSPKPLFSAKTDSGDFQPITGGIAVTPHSNGGYMVLFGTGKYFEKTDGDGQANGGAYDKDLQIQSFYGVRDTSSIDEEFSGGLTRSDLMARSFLSNNDPGAPAGSMYIDNKQYDVNKEGWYIDLGDSSSPQGERVIGNPYVRYGRVVFYSITPSTDACGGTGSSNLIEIMAEEGGAPSTQVFDWNGDGVFNELDSKASVKKIDDITSGITIIETMGAIEFKLSSGTGSATSTLVSHGESAEQAPVGRASWRQIR